MRPWPPVILWREGVAHVACALWQCAVFALTYWWLAAIGLSEPVAVGAAVVFALGGSRGQ